MQDSLGDAEAALGWGSQERIDWRQLTPDTSTEPRYGGMGIVYKASLRLKSGLGKPKTVAVKVLKTSQMSTLDSAQIARAVTAINDEAEIMSAVGCDGRGTEYVVKLYGLVQGELTREWSAVPGVAAQALPQLSSLQPSSSGAGAAGASFAQGSSSSSSPPAHQAQVLALVMAWEGGLSLKEKLHGATAWGAGTAERMALCAKIAEGLGHMHEECAHVIVHGDIKPDNVLLSATNPPAPRLADFGLSMVRDTVSLASRNSTQRAASDRANGTYPYMAPEMFAGLLRSPDGKPLPALKASRATDNYALGTLCWEVLTGCVPWEDLSPLEYMGALQRGDALDLERKPGGLLPADTPTSVVALLRNLLGPRKERVAALEAMSILEDEAEKMRSGHFDAFLSHAWEEGGRHAVITTMVCESLKDGAAQPLRVWRDTEEMGLDTKASMRQGIANSDCVVVLLSERYCTRPNCVFELQTAVDLGKPIIPLNANPTPGWFPRASVPGEQVVRDLLGLPQTLMPDLASATAEALRGDRTQEDCALLAPSEPTMRQRVRNKLKGIMPQVFMLIESAVRGAQAGVQGGAAAEAR